jgi:hypothetical protein
MTDGMTLGQKILKARKAAKAAGFQVEREPEGMTLAEQARAAAVLKDALHSVKGKLKLVAAGIDLPPGMPVNPSSSDILALERAVAELKKAAGLAA